MARKFYTSAEKVHMYETVINVFNELFKELKELGKRKPEQTLSAAKVKIINRVLVDVMECLDCEPDHKYLEELDDDVLPQYSDAILVLSQYEGALKSFRERHYGYQRDKGDSAWYVREDDDDDAAEVEEE